MLGLLSLFTASIKLEVIELSTFLKALFNYYLSEEKRNEQHYVIIVLAKPLKFQYIGLKLNSGPYLIVGSRLYVEEN